MEAGRAADEGDGPDGARPGAPGLSRRGALRHGGPGPPAHRPGAGQGHHLATARPALRAGVESRRQRLPAPPGVPATQQPSLPGLDAHAPRRRSRREGGARAGRGEPRRRWHPVRGTGPGAERGAPRSRPRGAEVRDRPAHRATLSVARPRRDSSVPGVRGPRQDLPGDPPPGRHHRLPTHELARLPGTRARRVEPRPRGPPRKRT